MDWKSIFSGLVVGLILGIGGTILVIERQIYKLEDKLAEKQQVVVTKKDTTSSSDPCFTAKFVGLSQNKKTNVKKTTLIKWTPDDCSMVVQAYKDHKCINEFHKIPKNSGEVTIGDAVVGNTGVMELKIWVPGSDTPAQQGVWIDLK